MINLFLNFFVSPWKRNLYNVLCVTYSSQLCLFINKKGKKNPALKLASQLSVTSLLPIAVQALFWVVVVCFSFIMCGAKSQLGFFGGAGSATPPLFFFYVNEMTRSSPVSFEKKNIDHFLSLHECTERKSRFSQQKGHTFIRLHVFLCSVLYLGFFPFFLLNIMKHCSPAFSGGKKEDLILGLIEHALPLCLLETACFF